MPKDISKDDVYLWNASCFNIYFLKVIFSMYKYLQSAIIDLLISNTSTYLFPSVLFIADVKVTFDGFKKCMIATCDQKTVITANPSKKKIFLP